MWRYGLPLLMFLALAVLLYSGLGKDTHLVPSPLINKPAPLFSLPDLLDPTRKVENAALKGKPYLLNVWASWCAACRQEHPVLMRFAAEKRLTLVGFNWKDAPADALAVIRTTGNPYDLIASDEVGRVGIDFGVYGAPESFLIDADGKILYKHVGPLDQDSIRSKILPLLPPGCQP
ncbi:MAG: DsbE family thiol:disulfide interchange protein [Lysobacterales bacterium CG_4_9_14_3_um_filter_62_6]|nr:MAG: DsbE family thiol:disulfide interchange protein [Xanthomonadales bacterium CG_4_9_14_3_um_filter_62_6]